MKNNLTIQTKEINLIKFTKHTQAKKKNSTSDFMPYFNATIYKEFAGEDFYC